MNNDSEIPIKEWYHHYIDLIYYLYIKFQEIAGEYQMTIKDTKYSYRDFIIMMYNESKNQRLVNVSCFDYLIDT